MTEPTKSAAAVPKAVAAAPSGNAFVGALAASGHTSNEWLKQYEAQRAKSPTYGTVTSSGTASSYEPMVVQTTAAMNYNAASLAGNR